MNIDLADYFIGEKVEARHAKSRPALWEIRISAGGKGLPPKRKRILLSVFAGPSDKIRRTVTEMWSAIIGKVPSASCVAVRDTHFVNTPWIVPIHGFLFNPN